MNHETLDKIALISAAVGEGISLVSELVGLFKKASTLSIGEVEIEIQRIQKIRTTISDAEQARLDQAVPRADNGPKL